MFVFHKQLLPPPHPAMLLEKLDLIFEIFTYKSKIYHKLLLDSCVHFSELSEVKEHDKRVTQEAHQAQEDVCCLVTSAIYL